MADEIYLSDKIIRLWMADGLLEHPKQNQEWEDLPSSVLRLIELRHLVITVDANHLKEIRAGYWTSLQYLKLHYCLELECLPEGMQYLKSLRTRTLVVKIEVEEEEDKDLQLSLKTLLLVDLHSVTDLPRLLLQGSSSTLQQLRIMRCPNLSVLPAWLLNLTSLHRLGIMDCRNLSALPEGIDRLTNLRDLRIYSCPQLSKRYRQNGVKIGTKLLTFKSLLLRIKIEECEDGRMKQWLRQDTEDFCI
ncbi:disease resistance protein RGA2-like [Gossypium arboreum]|uniref:disease resistance protein RGA2-like n=1 Tax=Gossypium arboreum TaxID=29729 RepID=UPI0022F155A5|nr:disease resistance protein RGA2-like [Gossypium arboreum]